MDTLQLKKEIEKLAARSFWIGVVIGIVLGLLAGLAISYKLGNPTNMIVPLSQGIRT